jgi:hypothetical protein
LFKALCVDVLLLEDDSLDPGGVVLYEDDCEAVLEDITAAPRPRLFLFGEETLLLLEDVEDDSLSRLPGRDLATKLSFFD